MRETLCRGLTDSAGVAVEITLVVLLLGAILVDLVYFLFHRGE